MNDPQLNPLAGARRNWLTLLAILSALPLGLLVALEVGVAGYFRLSDDTAALRKVITETAGQCCRKTVELNIGSWTTRVARLGLGLIPVSRQTREALTGVRTVEAGVYRLSEPVHSPKGSALKDAADRSMEGRGWERVVGVQHQDVLVLAYAPRKPISPDDVALCFVVIHGREVVIGKARSNLERFLNLWHAERAGTNGSDRFLVL